MSTEPRDAAYWAKDVTTLKVGDVPAEAINLNVTGRRVVGPVQGFGKMWQKTMRVSLGASQVTPAEVIATWKAEFQRLWPERNWFYAPGRHRPRRGGPAQPGPARPHEALHRGAGAVRRRRVVHPHDPRGHRPLGSPSRPRPSAGPPWSRSRPWSTNDPLYELGYVFGGNRLNTCQMGPDGREPGLPLRRRRPRGRLPGRLRRPAPPVAQGRQPRQERGHPHLRVDPGHAGALAAPAPSPGGAPATSDPRAAAPAIGAGLAAGQAVAAMVLGPWLLLGYVGFQVVLSLAFTCVGASWPAGGPATPSAGCCSAGAW